MGKKKQDQELTYLGYILAIIVGICILAVLCGPVILLIASLACLIKWKGTDKPLYENRFFWLSKAQQDEFYKASVGLDANIHQKNEVKRCVEREGIALKKDGSISERSNRGKALRQQYNDAQYWVLEYTRIVDTLKELPRQNYKKARRHYTNAIACFAGVLGYAIVLLKDQIMHGDYLASFKILWSYFNHKIELPTENSLILSLGIILGAYVIVWVVSAIKFSISFLEPPIVDTENYNKYIPYAKAKIAKAAAEKAKPQPSGNTEARPASTTVEKPAPTPVPSKKYTTLEKLTMLDQVLGDKAYDRHGIWENCVLFYELNADKDSNGNVCQGKRNKSIAIDIVITEEDEVQVAVFTRENNLNKNKEMAEQIFGEFVGCPKNPERHCAFCKNIDFNDKSALNDIANGQISEILNSVKKYRDSIMK